MFGSKSELEKQLPTQQYLEQVFRDLAKNKEKAKYKNLPHGTRFKGYKTIPIQKLEPKKSGYYCKIDGKDLWKKDNVKEVYCYQESCTLCKKSENGFFGAFFEAYITHGDVQITPDDVWMAIMLYFSKYVDYNAKQLQQAFVSHEGKKELVIETSETSEYEWGEFFAKVIVAIKDNTVKGVTENLECAFSTTDKFFTFFSTAVIMNSYKKYFDYTRRDCVCGIQNIHMGGTLEDWEKIAQRLSSLRQYDVDGRLRYYVQRLQPVIDQFVETYKGLANLEFWNNIYHERKNPYARTYEPSMCANGWILRFFTTGDVIKEEEPIEEIDVPIKVVSQLNNTVKHLNLVGGCRGMDVTGNAYRPHYSFSIVEKKQEKEK